MLIIFLKVPVANPDGYEYSREVDRMWRKNRRKVQNSKCDGVDLNRNFAKAYGTASSKNPCAQDFRGESAFSEPESAAIRFCSIILQGLTYWFMNNFLNKKWCRDYIADLQSKNIEWGPVWLFAVLFNPDIARIVSAISIHSYGNVLIFPWGYSMQKHPDKDRLSRLAYKMMNSVKWNSEDYEIYVPGTAFEVKQFIQF